MTPNKPHTPKNEQYSATRRSSYVGYARPVLRNCRYGGTKLAEGRRKAPSFRRGSWGEFRSVFHILYRLGRSGITEFARVGFYSVTEP